MVSHLGIMNGEGNVLRNHSDSRCGNEELISLTAVHHFRISSDELNSSLFASCLHGSHNPFQIMNGHPFFNDKRIRNKKRSFTTHCKIVHSSIDGQFTN